MGERSSPRGSGKPSSAAEEGFVLELPSDLQVLEHVVAYLVNRCRNHVYSETRLFLNFRVGVSEALANAILYGNRGDPGKRVRVAVALDEVRVAVEVTDEGNGFDPESVPDPTLPDNIQRSGGRGVFLMRKLMDEVEFGERGNSVRLVLYCREPTQSATGS